MVKDPAEFELLELLFARPIVVPYLFSYSGGLL